MRGIDFTLYLVTDRTLVAEGEFLNVLRKALEGGVKAVQLREKDLPGREILFLAREVRKLTSSFGAKLFINDRVDVALAVGAEGVHLREDSMPVSAVRRSFPELLVGRSTHSLEGALEAEREGADFITFGPVFETPSKRKFGPPQGVEKLAAVAESVSIPVFAIGGVKPERVVEVRKAGAKGIALISGIIAAPDPKEAAEKYLLLMKGR
ncbi:MAG: thiamine phosphate synthase [Deltaproteobacteria bacterium]|nr:MAG: thiamine phosphate synthase [Deltaproteobacteria bacterium]